MKYRFFERKYLSLKDMILSRDKITRLSPGFMRKRLSLPYSRRLRAG